MNTSVRQAFLTALLCTMLGLQTSQGSENSPPTGVSASFAAELKPEGQDTLPQRQPADTVRPQQGQSSPSASDTLPGRAVNPVAPKTTDSISPQPRALTPGPGRTISPPEIIPDVPETQIEPYDAIRATTVVWDSIMVPNDSILPCRIFAANTVLGEHLLLPAKKTAPEPFVAAPFRDLLTVLLFLCLLLLAFSRFFFPLKFNEITQALWNSQHYSQLEREGMMLRDWVSFLLFLNYIIAMLLLAYQSVGFFMDNPWSAGLHFPLFLLYTFLAIAAFYLIKYILMLFIAWVFKTQGPTHSYFRNIIISNQVLGVLLLPTLVLYAYNPLPIFLYLSILIFLTTNLLKLVRAAIIGRTKAGFTAYYLILYLCAIEIAPIIFLIKLSRNLFLS